MLPLAYRILTNNVHVYGNQIMEPASLAGIRQMIRDAVCIRADAVAELYYESQQTEWSFAEDFPNCAPPWPVFFVEWNSPPRIFVDGGKWVDMSLVKQGGAACCALEIQPGMTVESLVPHNRPKGMLEFFENAVNTGCRWILQNHEFSFCMQRVVYLGVQFLCIQSDGKVSEYSRILNPLLGLDGHQGPDRSVVQGHIIASMLSFSNCRNIQCVDHVPKPDESRPAKWHRRMKCPEIKFKVLTLDHLRSQVRSDSTDGGLTGLKKALHICRGHFANYTEQNPLFGKHVGTFWVPQHVRGAREFGEVEKEYKVK